MGRYFIHVIDGEQAIPDEVGDDFANVHQAKEFVIERARDLIQARLNDRSQWSRCDFLITNEVGHHLMRLPVRECLGCLGGTAGESP
ncbi:MAG TPA: hypothetical protein VHN13_13460 [Candidatus Tectomicrobia bacterium]|jgi:hypothetical protein|nr:hypothetical protein [Candidatus Tectomicrobia bacterium]